MENKKLTAEQILKQKGSYCHTVLGDSMYPMLRGSSDAVIIVPLNSKPKKYDVVLIRKDQENLVLHRIIKVKKDGYIFVGDNSFKKEKITDNQIIGVVNKFYRGEKLYSVDDIKYLKYAKKRVRGYYARFVKYKLKLFLCKIKRAIKRK